MSNQPEDYFTITITEEFVSIEHPLRKKEMIEWKDVQAVKIFTTDQGPFQPDVWLGLLGTTTGCLIPQGAKGYDEVYDIVSKFEGFDFNQVIQAMGSTENNEFLLWKKAVS